jgi:hypothetical protein
MNRDTQGGAGAGNTSKTVLAAFGIAALAVLCCVGGPLLAAVAGGLALGALLGIASGVVAVVVLGALIVLRASRRRACAPSGIGAEGGGPA